MGKGELYDRTPPTHPLPKEKEMSTSVCYCLAKGQLSFFPLLQKSSGQTMTWCCSLCCLQGFPPQFHFWYANKVAMAFCIPERLLACIHWSNNPKFGMAVQPAVWEAQFLGGVPSPPWTKRRGINHLPVPDLRKKLAEQITAWHKWVICLLVDNAKVECLFRTINSAIVRGLFRK